MASNDVGQRDQQPDETASEASADVLYELLEVAIHEIIFTRGIYPAVFFQQRRKYNIPVHMCVHPELNQYIRNVLSTVRALLLKNSVKKVVIEISNEHHKPIERFNFEIQSQQFNVKELLEKDKHLLHLEESMRAVCLKIGVCDAILTTRPPPNSSFKILIFTTADAATALEHQHQAEEFPWVEVGTREHSSDEDSKLVPLKTVDSPLLSLQVYVEQCTKPKQ